MKTLYLLRHAEAVWENNAKTADFDRPLDERGLKSIPPVAETILNRSFSIDLILSSPATRTRQTATLLKEAAQMTAEIRFDRRIYEASPRTLLEVVAETTDDKNSLMIVGHNPGIEDAIKVLTGETWSMKTAALAVIDADAARWRDIAAGRGKLRAFVSPTLEPDSSSDESWSEWLIKNTYFDSE